MHGNSLPSSHSLWNLPVTPAMRLQGSPYPILSLVPTIVLLWLQIFIGFTDCSTSVQNQLDVDNDSHQQEKHSPCLRGEVGMTEVQCFQITECLNESRALAKVKTEGEPGTCLFHCLAHNQGLVSWSPPPGTSPILPPPLGSSLPRGHVFHLSP
jgi:hypothetical protein